VKAERESVSVRDRHGQSPGWHGDRPPSQQFALEGLVNSPEQSGGQKLRGLPPKKQRRHKPRPKRGRKDRTTEGALKEPDGRGSAT
jgi:hypothetical protein